ncbi:MAG TPA: sodium:solute symporter family protein [bacterium]
MVLTVIIIYLLAVLAVGSLSHRLFRGTGEDYFVATRTIGPFILLMSLFGTHMTAFSLLGASAESYHTGIGVFALMASSSALVAPAVFFFIGTRAWAIGKQHGYLTQVQFLRERWNSDAVALIMFVALIGFLIPYLLIGVMGGGITLNEITNGHVPEWVGGLMVCIVVLVYVTYGGLRGTAWANTFQTLVFMTLGAVTFFVIVNKLGGFSNAMSLVAEQHPELLVRGDNIKPLKSLSYTLIPLSVGTFPHIFIHWLSAKRADSFRYPMILYPLCVAVVWIPSVLLGVLGTNDFSNLQGPAANSILIKMIGRYSPEVLSGFLAAGVFAAIMSSLDSQVLSIGTMFTQDIVRRYGFHDQMSERQQIFFGRIFVVAILAITFLLSQISNRSIFKLGTWSFTGFTALFPIVVAALYWKRSTKYGALASAITVVVLWIAFFIQGWRDPNYTIGGSGLMPVAVMLAASTLAMVSGSLLTKAPDEAILEKFFPSDGYVSVKQFGHRSEEASSRLN